MDTVEPSTKDDDPTFPFLQYTEDQWAQKLRYGLIDLVNRGCSPYQLDWSNVSKNVIDNCQFLHYAATFLMMSVDRKEVSLEFSPEHSCALAAAGQGFSGFKREVKKYDYSEKCNSVWHMDSIAYRCFTCARNPCMSLCAECFDAADHSSHDYSRFFSQSGGACDCGNSDILDPKGFCDNHLPNATRIEAPAELLVFPEFVMTKVLLRLAATFRQFGNFYQSAASKRTETSSKCVAESASMDVMEASEGFIKFLQEMVELGRPMIDVLSKIVCDEGLYQTLQPQSEPLESRVVNVAEVEMIFKKHELLLKDVDSLKASPVPNCLQIGFSTLKIEFKCLLDELIFYMVRLGFPQSLINLLLSLLPNNQLKAQFSCRFFEWYGLIDGLMYEVMNDGFADDDFEPNKIAARVIHASVQICSSKNVCIYLQEKVGILRQVLDSALKVIYTSSTHINAHHAIDCCYSRNADKTTDPEKWQVFNLNGNRFFSRFGHWYLTTDLQNLFAHIELCRDVFRSVDLSKRYVALLSALQGANILWRIVDGDHIETDSSHLMQRYFTVEWEVNSMLLFSSVVRMTKEDLPSLIQFATLLQNQLKEWFDAIGVTENHKKIPPFFCTSHIPLHRQLAATILQYLKLTNDLDVMGGLDQDYLSSLFIHPLRIQAMVSEYFAKMWVRNGNMARNNVYLYCQTALTNGFLDLDMSLMRLVCSKLDGWTAMALMFDAFHIDDCLNFPHGDLSLENVKPDVVITQREWIFPMIDGFFKLFLELLLIKSYVEMDVEEEVKSEVVHILSTNQQPYSKLRQNLPDRGSEFNEQVNSCFEKVVKNVAHFERPDQGNQIQQGLYILTDEAWYHDVDMIRARFRASSPREFNALLMRMEMALRGKLVSTNEARFVWPSFSIPDFECKIIDTYHLLLHPSPMWICRYVIDMYLVLPQSVPIHILQHTIYILTLMVAYATKASSSEAFKYLNSCLDYHSDVFDQHLQSSSEGMTASTGLSLFFSLFNETGIPTSLSRTTYTADAESLTVHILDLYQYLYSQEFRDVDQKQRDLELLKLCMRRPDSMKKMVGSGTDYTARLICYLYNFDPVSRISLDKRLRPADSACSLLTMNSLEKKNDFLQRKIAAKRRQVEIMKNRKSQSSSLMAKFLEAEGLKEDDIREKETTQRYDCPICNGSEGVEDVFGLFVYIQTTSVSNGMVHKESAALNPDSSAYHGRYERYCYWEKESMAIYEEKYNTNLVSHISTGELKVCGHYSHFRCFENYKSSVHENGITVKHRLSVPCPVCRSNVTSLIPLDINLKQDLPTIEERFIFDDARLAVNSSFFFNGALEIINQWDLLTKDCANQEVLANAYDNCKPFLLKLVQLNQHLEAITSVDGRRCPFTTILNDSLLVNPFRTILSVLRNQIDRASLITSLGYNYPTRLRNLFIDSMLKLSLCSIRAEDNNLKLLRSIWNKLNGTVDEGAPILLFDSSTLMIALVSSITSLPGMEKDQLRGFYRYCYCFCLVHNWCRTVLVYYLRTDRSQHGSVNPTTDIVLRAVRKADETFHIFDHQLTRRSVKFDELSKRAHESAMTFSAFTLNMMIEAGLLSPVADSSFHGCEVVEDLSKVIFGQSIPFSRILELVGGKVDLWMQDLGPVLNSEDGIREIFLTEAWWAQRELKEPPLLFDSLFNTYFKHKCSKCLQAPSQPFICMACGTTVCFDDCCDVTIEGQSNQISEVEQHTYSCTAGVGCFLSLTSTMIVIIHGGLCNLWGSIYLDDHGEEDRNLRRGKKLTLSTTRLRRLTELWVNHDFDRSVGNRSWFPVEHLPHILKECHLYPS